MKFNNKKKIIVGSIIGVLIGTLLSVSYAFFTFSKTNGTKSTLVTGNIWMKYGETNGLTLENAMPSDTYDSTHKFEFTIEGANTTTDKDVWYEIIAKRGNVPDGKTEDNRLQDKYIKFTLTKQIGNGTIETVVDGESWEGLTSGKKIYVDKIDKNTNSTTHKYVLYMWISNKVGIGTNTTYTISDWNNLFASIKVDVTGDFTTKTADEPYMTVNAMQSSFYDSHLGFPNAIYNQKSNIKEVYFNRMKENEMQTAYNNATIKAELTYNNEGKVLAWLETNQTDNTKYNLIIASDGKTYLINGSSLFDGFSSMTNIYFNNLDTSRLVAGNTMFKDCSSLVTLNLSSFDTSSLYQTPNMFQNCTSLVELDLSSFGSHSLFMPQMFNNCIALETIYVSSLWNTTDTSQGIPIFVNNMALVGKAPNRTYAFDSSDAVDKTYAVIATDSTPGYLTDISLKP